MSENALVIIKILRDCEGKRERLLHPEEGCSCSTMEQTWFYKDEEIDPNSFSPRVDISGLKFNEDYTITEYP